MPTQGENGHVHQMDQSAIISAGALSCPPPLRALLGRQQLPPQYGTVMCGYVQTG